MSISVGAAMLVLLKAHKKRIVWCLGVVLVYGALLGVVVPKVALIQAKKLAEQRLGLTLEVERLRLNPFMFTVDIQHLALRQPQGGQVFGFERFLIDFEVSSLFRWAWTLKHLELTGFTAHLERYSKAENTLSRLQDKWLSSVSSGEPAVSNVEKRNSGTGSPELPRFLVRNIRLEVESATIVDNVPQTPFSNTIGPINIGIDKLTSLPDRVGVHRIVIKGDRGIAVSWQGDIDLTLMSSRGEITVKGPYPVIASDYLQDSLPVVIDSGDFSMSLNYQLQAFAEPSKPLSVYMDNIDVFLDNFSVKNKATLEPLYYLEQFALANASVQWPEQVVLLPHIVMRGGEAWLQRDAEGITNVEHLLASFNVASKNSNPNSAITSSGSVVSTQNVTPAQGSAKGAEAMPWSVKNTLFELDSWALHWLDKTIAASPEYKISDISLALRDYEFKDHAPLSFDYGLSLSGGQVSGQGSVVPMPFGSLKSSVTIEQVLLTHLQPYIASAARVLMSDGVFNGNALIESQAEGFALESTFSVSDLKVLNDFDGAVGSPQDILSWKKLTFDNVQAATHEKAVSINHIILEKPFADFAIEQDGTTTIDKILIAKAPSSEASQAVKTPKDEALETADSEGGFHFNIGSIQIVDGGGYFADASLPLPFATKIHHLNGGITSLDSQSQAASDLTMEGQLDEYGLLNVKGRLSPFAFDQSSDIALSFKNVNVPNFTPYSVKFAGRKITDGRLDLNLQYVFDKGEMKGANDVVLKSFDLGESIDQPGAMDLPLDLAIALLKDGEGKITMNIPVKGDVNSPEFSIGDIVGQALVKILKSAITSPFRLLAGIVGGDADDFGRVEFLPGRSDITPPEKEKLDALAEAMLARPELALEIAGVFDEQSDVAILQQQQFSAQVKAHFGDQFNNLSLSSKEYLKYLESRYEGLLLAPALPQLQQLQQQFIPQENNKLDSLAYAKAIKQRLIAEEVLPGEALKGVANLRASNVKALLLAQGIAEHRLAIVEPVRVEVSSGGLIMMLDVAVAD